MSWSETHLDNLISTKDYEGLWKCLSEGKAEYYSEWDKDRKRLYWLSFLERKSFSDEGKHGILGGCSSVREALSIFDSFKKMLQRLEWWPEFEVPELKAFIMRYGISNTEIIWIMDAYTLDSQYALDRFKGKCEARDLFFRGEDEINALVIRHGKYLEDRGGETEKICFITCCNNQAELEEMNAWIGRLWIPEGMEIESIEISDAVSMCSGYNEAMRASNARYKVYLHQDVRILNPFFIFDLVDEFINNPKAGMVGMMGADRVPESGVMWETSRYGAVIHTEFNEDGIASTIHECSPYEGGDFSAALTDGFCLATQKDIAWREDVFKGWDFYDASQSLEFRNRGYEIIIPHQEVAWCLHDFGQINWGRYEDNRAIFVSKYLS